jgi:DNA-binding transcriptional ArsR family regulator
MREPHHPSPAELELSSVLHALSDPGRLAIVEHLGSGCECACGCFSVGLSKPTLSHHLRVLREAGVTYTRCEGRQRLISLRRDDLEARFPGLLDAVLAADHAPIGSPDGRASEGPGRGGGVRPLGLEPRPPT